MKKRLGFVCNSSSSDYIIDSDCEYCNKVDKEDFKNYLLVFCFKELEKENSICKTALNLIKDKVIDCINSF